MIIGYLDPEGNAYDLNVKSIDKRILDPNENPILENEENIVFKGKVKSHGFSHRREVFTDGYGILFKTNKRIIFIREIDPISKIKGGYGALPTFFDYLNARDMKKQGAKEFFEAETSEIKKINIPTFWKGFILFIQDKNNKYEFFFKPKHEIYSHFMEFQPLTKGEKWYG